MPVRVFGLTGGIASGKSTVARLFAERGAAVLSADEVAREVVAPGSPTLEAVRAAFGAEVFNSDGSLDREALGERSNRVFHANRLRFRLTAS